jgi:type I restriction enzyme, S subunit
LAPDSPSCPWRTERLDRLADVVDPHPSHRAPPIDPDGIPFPGIGDISENGEINLASARPVSSRTINLHRARYQVEPGDIGFGRVATVGKVIRFGKYPFDFALSPTMAFIKPTRADAGFLLHSLRSNAVRQQIAKLLTGTTRSSLGIELLRTLRLPNPALSEQRCLAGVLDTIDEAIRGTQRVIAKLELLKLGLLYKLFTQGIDENGALRDPELHPEQFRDSLLGRIPASWEATTLGSVARRITDGTHQAVRTVPDGEDAVPFLYVSSIRHGEIMWRSAARINRATYAAISRGREPASGMILFTAVGSYGHAAVVHELREFAFQRHIACIYPNHDSVDSRFLVYWLNSEACRRHSDRVAIGNAQRTVTLAELARYPTPLPPLEEQSAISELLLRLDAILIGEYTVLRKSGLLKDGLREDLLSGHVQVSALMDGDRT